MGASRLKPVVHQLHGDALILTVGDTEDVAGNELDGLDHAHWVDCRPPMAEVVENRVCADDLSKPRGQKLRRVAQSRPRDLENQAKMPCGTGAEEVAVWDFVRLTRRVRATSPHRDAPSSDNSTQMVIHPPP